MILTLGRPEPWELVGLRYLLAGVLLVITMVTAVLIWFAARGIRSVIKTVIPKAPEFILQLSALVWIVPTALFAATLWALPTIRDRIILGAVLLGVALFRYGTAAWRAVSNRVSTPSTDTPQLGSKRFEPTSDFWKNLSGFAAAAFAVGLALFMIYFPIIGVFDRGPGWGLFGLFLVAAAGLMSYKLGSDPSWGTRILGPLGVGVGICLLAAMLQAVIGPGPLVATAAPNNPTVYSFDVPMKNDPAFPFVSDGMQVIRYNNRELRLPPNAVVEYRCIGSVNYDASGRWRHARGGDPMYASSDVFIATPDHALLDCSRYVGKFIAHGIPMPQEAFGRPCIRFGNRPCMLATSPWQQVRTPKSFPMGIKTDLNVPRWSIQDPINFGSGIYLLNAAKGDKFILQLRGIEIPS